MYNQPPESNNQYSGQQYEQQFYNQPHSDPYSQPYSQQPYSQPPYNQPPYNQPVSGQVPPYAQPYGQQVPPYAQPLQYNIQVGVGVTAPQKDWLTTLLLCIFLGWLGVHSFYTGRIAFGVIQLLTFGGCGIWTLVDFILILTNSYTDNYGRPLLRN